MKHFLTILLLFSVVLGACREDDILTFEFQEGNTFYIIFLRIENFTIAIA